MHKLNMHIVEKSEDENVEFNQRRRIGQSESRREKSSLARIRPNESACRDTYRS